MSVHIERLKYFDLPPIESISADKVVRLWTPAVMIQASQNKNEYTFTIYTYVQEVWRGEVTDRRFVGVENFDSIVGGEIIDYIKTESIDEIPSDKFINGWGKGLDGITYIIEILSDKGYSFKHYWSPSPDIPEAVRIIEFKDYVLKLVADNSQSLVQDEIPFPGYHYYGSSYNVIQPLSAKEFKKLSRQRKREIKASKDSSLFIHIDSLIQYQIGYQYEVDNRNSTLNDSFRYNALEEKTYFKEVSPLIIMDGELIRKYELLKYQLSQIKQIDAIRKNDPGMRAIYGTSAKNGVVIIQTKKFYRKKRKGRSN